MLPPRAAALAALAGKLIGVPIERPLRVAVDGRTASGKTTLADELADAVRRHGRPVIRTSIDGFHRPRAERYARGRYSAEGYYWDARDLPAIMAQLLQPLGPDGDRCYRTASFDLENDCPIAQEPLLAPADSVLIVDGTFLQRAELSGGWDVTIFVVTAEAVAVERGVGRDAAQLGGVETARRLYDERYRPAFDIYNRLAAPAANTDVLFHNDEFDRPRLEIRRDGRLGGV